MPGLSESVKRFIDDSYQLVSASSPTVPLKGDDTTKGLYYLNRLISSYSSSGLLIPVARQVNFPILTGTQFVTFGSPDFTPTPDFVGGRLANADNVWIVLDNLTYPLKIVDRAIFQNSYKYFPQEGLPRFAIIYYETNVTKVQIYPAPSQFYELFVYGKFALPTLTENSDMSLIPDYMQMFLQFALGKYYSRIKGRSSAWTQDLEADYQSMKRDIEAVSTVDLSITADDDSYLNGSWRVRAGV